TSLLAKLDGAQRKLANGHPGKAAHKLVAFAHEVRAFKHAHILGADAANLWLFEVENIRSEIRGGN
ncbi:MAG TPA: hypothetical protein VMB21_12535, partial [Candidatus Limnocylindria bacterium]|nr:hypothetical protein [Candidatus Limnocylindria bacterium]